MANYHEMDRDALTAEKAALEQAYKEFQAKGLKLNMARGKPGPHQMDLAMDLLKMTDYTTDAGTDARNYGELKGLESARKLFADILGCKTSQVFAGGNSSLQLMYDTVSKAYTHGLLHSEKPWCKEESVKWLCPAPGYDRHFKVTENFGFELITIPMTENGPDMDIVENLIKDPSVKGMWNVPKYSNPDGIIYSDKTIERIAKMKPAAPDFLLMWDNAYCIHEFDCDYVEFPDIISLCAKYGNADMVYEFASTSKVTFPGAGVGVMASSADNIAYFSKLINIQTIGFDKLNQLRHVRFLPTIEAVKEHMKKHAEFLRPRFEAVERKLTEGLGETGCATWTHPRGGYFVSFDGPEGSAQKVAALCADLGVKLTPAGATWPYGKDPRDTNIRIAPSYPTVEDLEAALDVLVLAVKLVAAELARAERA